MNTQASTLGISISAAEEYDLWSTRVFALLMISYTMFFLVRQNFALAVPFMQHSLDIDKTQIGTIMSVSLLIFSIGKFVCGFFTHWLSPKKFLAFGLVGSSVTNILVAQNTSPSGLLVLWSFNALFQCFAWPQCIRLMSDWCSQQQIATRWSLISLAYQFGSVVVFSCFTFLIEWYGWEASFFVPGVIGVFAGFLLLALPLESPTELGLVARETRFGLKSEKTVVSASAEQGEFWLIAKEVLCNRFIWLISFATFFSYVVKTGFSFWAPSYLNEVNQLSATMIGTYMLGFEGAGAVGGLASGWLSDNVFKGKRGPVAVLYFAGIFIFLIGLFLMPNEYPFGNALLLAGLGFTITGPQIMAGTASFDFSSKRAAMAANGFTGLFAGLGSAIISGSAIGFLAQYYGWACVFMLLAACCVVAAGLFWKIC
jgi:OPA family sugar phosphate sensor protein UhpC-like MFS transporter